MLSHDINFPQIPPMPDFPGISHRTDRWQRQAITLWLIAQGFSMGIEVEKIVAGYFGISHRSGALRQVLPKLKGDGLLKTEMLALRLFHWGQTRFLTVCLADLGRELVQDLGWPVHEGDWERMRRLHEKGNYQPQHTAAVLAFVYQARLRGWAVGVMPKVDGGRFQPDAVVEKGNESYYVEVELDEQKPGKWHNMARYQGVIAFCARTPEHHRHLLDEARSAAEADQCVILGTDLRSLFEQVEGDSILWLDT